MSRAVSDTQQFVDFDIPIPAEDPPEMARRDDGAPVEPPLPVSRLLG
jgi:hypothetical protein